MNDLFLMYGPLGKENYYNVHEICVGLGPDICKRLPFFHALTGCDTTSSFYKVGKNRFWNEWIKVDKEDPSLTSAFKNI